MFKNKTQEQFDYEFKFELSLQRRFIESEKVRKNYKDRVAVIIERSTVESSLPVLEQTKFLIPIDYTYGQFQAFLRKKLSLEKKDSLFIYFSTNKLQSHNKLMGQVYEQCKDEDGFLYCKYAGIEIYG
eukprot:403354646